MYKWYHAIPMAELTLNNRRLYDTFFAPFYVTYGFHCFTPADLLRVPATSNPEETAKLFVQRMRSDFTTFQDFLKQLQSTPSSPDPRFYVGQKVWHGDHSVPFLLITTITRLRYGMAPI